MGITSSGATQGKERVEKGEDTESAFTPTNEKRVDRLI